MIYILMIVGILFLDQLTKWLIVANLGLGESIPLIGFFKLTYVQNTGAAFSLFSNGTLFLIILTMVFLGVMVYLWHKPFMKTYKFSVAIIIGGALGNFIDRILHGYVVDFFNFTYFPVFNIADIALCCGVGLLALQIIFDKEGETNDNNGKNKN
ncbi:MAG: signal peptidase II [Clostridiales bacterium]